MEYFKTKSLLPIIHQNKDKSIQLNQSVIDKFDEIWGKIL